MGSITQSKTLSVNKYLLSPQHKGIALLCNAFEKNLYFVKCLKIDIHRVKIFCLTFEWNIDLSATAFWIISIQQDFILLISQASFSL